jgi:hypothetical protein
MAYTTINKSTDYFNTKLYSGNGSATQAITGVGHQPDLVWIKSRSNTESHILSDVVRGSTKRLRADTTNAEDDIGLNGIQSFDTDGFTAGDGDGMNASGQTYASWNWKANGAGSANTDGSINTTYTSANTTAGFSISTYTGTGSSATIGHGLGASPDVVIIKKTSHAEDWNFQTSALGYGNYLVLNSTGASASAGGGLVSAVSSTTVTVDSNSYVNSSGATYVMYCFAEKKGYSKFGSYEGNGNVDGAFVYTGFKPAWIMVKRAGGVTNWQIQDSKRDGFNDQNKRILANVNEAEKTSQMWDQLSNGFKIRVTSENANGSGMSYIYMAFAEEPLVANVGTNGVPATAR